MEAWAPIRHLGSRTAGPTGSSQAGAELQGEWHAARAAAHLDVRVEQLGGRVVQLGILTNLARIDHALHIALDALIPLRSVAVVPLEAVKEILQATPERRGVGEASVTHRERLAQQYTQQNTRWSTRAEAVSACAPSWMA